jgi:hypothetical protein
MFQKGARSESVIRVRGTMTRSDNRDPIMSNTDKNKMAPIHSTS